jgi:hypothetical protein
MIPIGQQAIFLFVVSHILTMAVTAPSISSQFSIKYLPIAAKLIVRQLSQASRPNGELHPAAYDRPRRETSAHDL